MSCKVLLLEAALADLEVIYHYLKQKASAATALREIEGLETACASLTDHPERGSVPHELERIDVLEYRQIIAKPYRIIYQVTGKTVYVYGIVHGKRNIQEILNRRLYLPYCRPRS